MPHPHWRDGGAVNAIEKMKIVLDAVDPAPGVERAGRQEASVPGSGRYRPTRIEGGVWIVTYPPSCNLICDVQYLPGNIDAEGTGKAVERELLDYVNAAADADPWLREHPLQWEWMEDIVPAEVPDDHPIVSLALEAAAAVGRQGRIGPRLLARRRPFHALGRHADGLVRTRRHRERAIRSTSASRSRAWSTTAPPSPWPSCAGAASEVSGTCTPLDLALPRSTAQEAAEPMNDTLTRFRPADRSRLQARADHR